MWVFYALGSAFFAGATAVLAKAGLKNMDSTLATALRTVVVALFAWAMVFVVGSQTTMGSIGAKPLVFLLLSGMATGASWLCYYRALQDGPASVVVPVDKLSILVTVIFARIWFGEKLSQKFMLGLGLIVAGTLLLLVP